MAPTQSTLQERRSCRSSARMNRERQVLWNRNQLSRMDAARINGLARSAALSPQERQQRDAAAQRNRARMRTGIQALVEDSAEYCLREEASVLALHKCDLDREELRLLEEEELIAAEEFIDNAEIVDDSEDEDDDENSE